MKISLRTIRALFITTALTGALIGTVSAQEAPSEPGKIKPEISGKPPANPRIEPLNKRKEPPKKNWFPAVRNIPTPIINFGGGTYEKSIAVDARVNVSLCVTQGDVKINGWERKEVRVFIKDGSKIGFNILQKGRQNEMPVWIKVVGTDPAKPAVQRDCIWGDVVEIDAPTGAAVNLEGKETRIVVDSIRKVGVKNAGGNISIRNVTEGINALTYEGDVDVENSDGMITLTTTTGNIVGFELGPSQVGDMFRAKTNSGRISLQKLEHRQVDVNSISGSVLFNGELLTGGIYNIGTSNGSLSLGIPPDSPCMLSATYGEGDFSSELPFKLLTENVTPGPVKRITATLGKGDCKLNLSTASGVIRLRKQ
jgi:hypothetical protein